MCLEKGPVIGITADPGQDLSGGRASLREEYALAVLNAGGVPVAIPVFSPEDPQRVFFESMDGILVPGGDDIAPSYYGEKQRAPMKLVPPRRTDFEISLIRAAVSQNMPLLGICYGMQLINVALGGSLYQDLETDLNESSVIKKGRATVEHRRGLHEIMVLGTGPLPAGRYTVNSSHHQGVSRLANGLSPAAHAEDGLVEAFYLKEHTFLTGVQWHPERMAGDPVACNIFSSFIRAARKAGRK